MIVPSSMLYLLCLVVSPESAAFTW